MSVRGLTLAVLTAFALGIGADRVWRLGQTPGDALEGARPEATEQEADDDDEVTVRNRIEQLDGRRVVALTDAERALAGIEVVDAYEDSVVPEMIAFAEVVDDVALLGMIERRRALESELAVQRQVETEFAQRIARMGASIASGAERTRLTAELMAIKRERIRLEGEVAQAMLALRRQVGQLADVLTDDSPLVDSLKRGQARLVALTLPLGERLPTGTTIVYLSTTPRREDARKGYLLARAPGVGTATRTARYFLKTASGDLQPGTLLDAYVPDPSRAVIGVLVPDSALVRHAGSTWAYVETGSNVFARVRLPDVAAFSNRRVVKGDIAPGDRVVSRGAQSLLAEEFRAAIPEEDDD